MIETTETERMGRWWAEDDSRLLAELLREDRRSHLGRRQRRQGAAGGMQDGAGQPASAREVGGRKPARSGQQAGRPWGTLPRRDCKRARTG